MNLFKRGTTVPLSHESHNLSTYYFVDQVRVCDLPRANHGLKSLRASKLVQRHSVSHHRRDNCAILFQVRQVVLTLCNQETCRALREIKLTSQFAICTEFLFQGFWWRILYDIGDLLHQFEDLPLAIAFVAKRKGFLKLVEDDNRRFGKQHMPKILSLQCFPKC